MDKIKVLHITNWYPTDNHPEEALWIKRLIDSLPECKKNFVLHFEIKEHLGINSFRKKRGNIDNLIFYLPIKSWFIKEWIYFFWLFYHLRIRKTHRNYDLINFHIAYPMLTHWDYIKKYVRIPIVISEHWSAYHFNFGVKKELPRIQKIFNQNIPVITVSNALLCDIKKFSYSEFPSMIIPNVVDSRFYFSDVKSQRRNFFFMLSQWKEPKNPFIAIKAFLNFNRKHEESYKLIVGGYGPQWNEMQEWILRNDANDYISMVEKPKPLEIGNYMRTCKAFLHPSDYETFSVVCAEAVSCGAPVVASNVGGIKEVVSKFGILINEHQNEAYWEKALCEIINIKLPKEDKRPDFDKVSIGLKYEKFLMSILDDSKK